MSSIAERLREERERLRISQSDFSGVARAAGVPGATRQSQARYEKGVQIPSAAYMEAIATTGADVQYIITGQRAGLPTLSKEEECLLDNYRHSPADKRAALQEVSAAFSKQPSTKAVK